MRFFCILVSTCIVAVYSKSDKLLVECGKKCKVDVTDEILEKLNHNETFKTSNEAYCLLDCVISQEKLSKGKKRTYYEWLIEDVKIADESNISDSRGELENKLNECKDKGLQGVDFLKCIKFLEPPFANYFLLETA